METTFVMIKPDAIAKGLVDEIIQRIETAGLRVVEKRRMRLTQEQAEKLYEPHRGTEYYGRLVDFTLSGDVVVMKVEGENAISRMRRLIGPLDPTKAPKGTIRGDYGTVLPQNVIHAADSPESAQRELSIFF